MNNSAFGKAMENIRNHKDMKLVTSEQKYKKYVMNPNFKDGRPFSRYLFAVEMGKTEIKMNKPVSLAQAILGLSKTLMYEFLYHYMRLKYGSKVKLCYIDIGSFVYEIETDDFCRDIAKDVEKRFDTSGYPKDENRSLPFGKNKKVIGVVKNGLGGKIMIDFIALRAKRYAYRKIKKKWWISAAKVQKSVWLLKALCLMTIRPACLMVKQYSGSKYYLRVRIIRFTRSISIR